MKQWRLFIAFFRVGMLGYGGGPSSIPLIHKEVVDKYKWLNKDDFSDVLAIGNALPGPIATKLAGYVGWRIGGLLGMLNAIIATTLPTVILLLLLLSTLNHFKNIAWVQGMSNAVVPVVGVMLATLTWEFIKKSKESLGLKTTGLILVASFILLYSVNVHPAILIGCLIGFAFFSRSEKEQKKKVKAS
ncbi:chromate transporter [Bacillus sp. EAC]|uniref:chromate transporter n=1 Tax=Bacillus sp. EAC TaxID=1978338 RepID=UPI000B447DCC|nr:chromate transporter [Bacillus sp. EAC]